MVRMPIHIFLFLAVFSLAAIPSAWTLDWKQCLKQDEAWYGTPQAIRIAEQVLLYQRHDGGWPKNTNFAKSLSREEIQSVLLNRERKDSTIDNGGTYTPIRFLARVYDHVSEEHYRVSLQNGVDFLLDIQYENGGWPQYSGREGYYSRITYNDNAMLGVMRLLDDIAERRSSFAWGDDERVRRCKDAVHKGIQCILHTQVQINGVRTVWCAQHDENTLEPASARVYEKASLSGSESVEIVRFLMSRPNPDGPLMEAITSAIAWFRRSALKGIRVERISAPELPTGYDKRVVNDEEAPDIWARFYELNTNRPIFSGRDGIVKYSLDEIEHERRVGYSWYTTRPASLLENEYPLWRQKHGLE